MSLNKIDFIFFNNLIIKVYGSFINQKENVLPYELLIDILIKYKGIESPTRPLLKIILMIILNINIGVGIVRIIIVVYFKYQMNILHLINYQK